MIDTILKKNIQLFTFLLSLSTWMLFSACTTQQGSDHASKELSYFEQADSLVQTGGVKLVSIQTPKGAYKVWTKRVGNNPTLKVLILHGGPGGTHEGYESFESFLPKEGIEFIYYDQLGSGHSDHPSDTSLYDLSRYVEEVEQVRQALHLDSSNFLLYGHSWGGLLAMQYALKYQQHLKALIISNMMASCPEYGKYANEVLAKQMPAVVLDTLRMLEKKGDFENPRYMELLMTHFYAKHVLRLPDWPEPVTRMFGTLNRELYTMMQGPSEFGVSGKLKNWDISKELKHIKTPTLVIGATYDTMNPSYMEWMSKEFQNGEFVLCKNGSHMSLYDDQPFYFKGLIRFIKNLNT
jgi:proline iminopeptidase